VENELHLVLDNVPGMLVQFDTELRYLYVNKHARQLLSTPQHPEPIGLRLIDIIGAGAFAPLVPVFERALSGEQGEYQRPFRRPDGEVGYLHAHLLPCVDDAGRVTSIYAIASEVTGLMRDELTGAPNRRSILEFAAAALHARRGDKDSLCLALIDIDHFKTVNDTFGHDVGDAVLKAFFASCLRQLRSTDRLGRFGGEEFLLVMPGTFRGQVAAIHERLRRGLCGITVPGLPAHRAITFSMGVAELTGTCSLDELIKQADEALYRAKQAGRDRLMFG